MMSFRVYKVNATSLNKTLDEAWFSWLQFDGVVKGHSEDTGFSENHIELLWEIILLLLPV